MGRNLLIFLATGLLCAVALECGLRQLYPPPPVWRDPQIRHLESPLLGWVLPARGEAYTIDQVVRTNRYRLRDDEFPRSKPPGEFRILVLGDSFTFGLGVAHDDLYTEQVEQFLDEIPGCAPAQVINAGVAGYNTTQELIYLLREGLSFQPDLVVLGFYWNDLVGNEAELPPLDSTPLVTAEAGVRAPPRHRIPAFIRDRLRQWLTLYLAVTRAKDLVAAWTGPPNPYQVVQKALLAEDEGTVDRYWGPTRARLARIAGTLRAAGIPFLVLRFPMEPEIGRVAQPSLLGRRLAEFASSEGVTYVDLGPPYERARRDGRNPFLPYDRHPNAVGMAIAARELLAPVRAHCARPEGGTP